jgi:hypothetical protein
MLSRTFTQDDGLTVDVTLRDFNSTVVITQLGVRDWKSSRTPNAQTDTGYRSNRCNRNRVVRLVCFVDGDSERMPRT